MFHDGDYHKLRTEFQVRRNVDSAGSATFSTSLMDGTSGDAGADISV
ncbi:hypothetical protein RMSM_01262 [Rhodopirellula maiorica SM1]|uniref:Uncharacterized protein n=1 Tax=Rhodopirellula maiorica SM1 TaxID=1265738 RepID=M5S2F8_9BACT|nr:hypothetical protein RMSM_01262 [Rhodopirellula maiorica SM1]